MQVENWDHLRFLLAAHREGTLTRAAQALGTDQTTVSRRLRALEEQADAQLFEQLRGGVVLTSNGERWLQTALEIEERFLLLDRDLLDRSPELQGPVRVTLPVLYAFMFMKAFAAVRQRHPGIELEVVADDGYRNITRREADIALRASDAPPEHLVGRRIAELTVAIYGTRALAEAYPDAQRRPWIGAEGADPSSINERWRARLTPNAPVAMRTSNMLALLAAVKAGIGVSVLAEGIEAQLPELVRLSGSEVIAPMWVLTHRETRRSARIRAVMDLLYELLTLRLRAL